MCFGQLWINRSVMRVDWFIRVYSCNERLLLYYGVCIPVMRERLPRRICARWHPLTPYYPSLYLYFVFHLAVLIHFCCILFALYFPSRYLCFVFHLKLARYIPFFSIIPHQNVSLCLIHLKFVCRIVVMYCQLAVGYCWVNFLYCSIVRPHSGFSADASL